MNMFWMSTMELFAEVTAPLQARLVQVREPRAYAERRRGRCFGVGTDFLTAFRFAVSVAKRFRSSASNWLK
jgi:hypothetical protein